MPMKTSAGKWKDWLASTVRIVTTGWCISIGDIPFITEEITGPRYDFYSTRREAILRYLKNDLDRTAPYLKNNVYIGMVTQAAAYHLLTKINLALGEFDDAVESANKVINDGVHHLMTERFGIDKADNTKNVIWDLHQSANKSLPENKEVLYMVLDRYDAGEDIRSAAGLEIKRQVLPGLQRTGKSRHPMARTDLLIMMPRKILIWSNMVAEYVRHVLRGIIHI